MTTETNKTGGTRTPVVDRRKPPRGVLPKQLQTWLMVGIAAAIVIIILITGHSQPSVRPQTERSATPTLPAADRIRAYQQQLSDDEARLQAVQAEAAQETRHPVSGASSTTGPRPAEPPTDDERRLEHQSLFADNVAFSRRGGQPLAAGGVQAQALSGLSPEAQAALAILAEASAAKSSSVADPRAVGTSPNDSGFATAPALLEVRAFSSKAQAGHSAPGERYPLVEGTVIETVLLNRLDGTFAGPVECLVTTPVYSRDRQTVLIPAGARVLGAAAPVQNWGDSRLAVSFHRLVMPDGHTYSLDQFKGLGQRGDTGLRDEINRHYLQVFGASLAIGAISGLAQYGTRGIDANTFGDASRQSEGASLATSSSRVLDRYLNALPTITIREGFRIKVYLTSDLELPGYAATGGLQ